MVRADASAGSGGDTTAEQSGQASCWDGASAAEDAAALRADLAAAHDVYAQLEVSSGDTIANLQQQVLALVACAPLR
jgi:hypothetical protein